MKKKKKKKITANRLAVPEKKDAVLYARIKPVNKDFLTTIAGQEDRSVAYVLDLFLDDLRGKYAGNKRRRA